MVKGQGGGVKMWLMESEKGLAGKMGPLGLYFETHTCRSYISRGKHFFCPLRSRLLIILFFCTSYQLIDILEEKDLFQV